MSLCQKKETFLTEDSAMKVIPPGHILTFCDADYSAAGNINLTIVATIYCLSILQAGNLFVAGKLNNAKIFQTRHFEKRGSSFVGLTQNTEVLSHEYYAS